MSRPSASFFASVVLALAGCNAVFGLEAAETTTPLTDLIPSRGVLVPAFDPSITHYTLAVSVLAQQVTFTPEGPAGFSVRILDDTVLLGTPSAPIRLPMGGSQIEIHVDEPDDGRTTYTIDVDRGGIAPVARRLASTTPIANGYFGTAFAVDGDRVAIAAIGESPQGVEDCEGDGTATTASAGAVHVYRRTRDGYQFEQRVEPPLGTRCASFGQSIALSGDRLVVGSWSELWNGNLWAGVVHLYELQGSRWEYQRSIFGPGFPPAGRFGLSVAAVDGWVLVGAPGIEVNRGRVYAFHENDGFAIPQTLGRHVDQAGAQIGYAIAVDGTRLVASAPGDLVGGTLVGSIAVHALANGLWLQQGPPIRAASPVIEDRLGTSLGLEGGRLVAGAPLAGGRRGEMHVFSEDAGGVWGETADLQAATGAAEELFGNQVALRGDLAVTGWCKAPVALAGWSTVEPTPTPPGPAGAGVAMIYQLDTVPPRLVGALGRDVPEASAHFGCMNQLTEDRLFLGAHAEDQNGLDQAGAAYIVE